MREVITKVYQFAELNERAKARAVESFRDINVDDSFWSECVVEDWKERLREKIGIDGADIRFSGFCSQGDGASYSGRMDADWIIKFVSDNKDSYPLLSSAFGADDPPVVIYEAKVERIGSFHYVHEKTCHVVLDMRMSRDSEIDAKEIDGEVNRLEHTLEAIRLDLCREMYADLEKEYDYRTSTEAIVETIESNEYEFTEDGKQFRG